MTRSPFSTCQALRREILDSARSAILDAVGKTRENRCGGTGDTCMVYTYIPGSSRYVNVLPFCRFLQGKRHKFYTQKEDPGI